MTTTDESPPLTAAMTHAGLALGLFADPALRHFADAKELRRFQDWRCLLSKTEITACVLAQRARLQHRKEAVSAALEEDPRLLRVTMNGPRRYCVRPEYRSAFRQERQGMNGRRRRAHHA